MIYRASASVLSVCLSVVPVDVSDETRANVKHTLLSRARHVLPSLKWAGESALWAGCRPMSPDSLPIVGPLPRFLNFAPQPPVNVYVSCGHGANGWTMSAATASMLTGIIARRHGSPSLHWDPDARDGSLADLESACWPGRFWFTAALNSVLVAARVV